MPPELVAPLQGNYFDNKRGQTKNMDGRFFVYHEGNRILLEDRKHANFFSLDPETLQPLMAYELNTHGKLVAVNRLDPYTRFHPEIETALKDIIHTQSLKICEDSST